ncbi:MAG: hypothetical protein WD993_07250 [Thermoleophilaceae bacterium]
MREAARRLALMWATPLVLVTAILVLVAVPAPPASAEETAVASGKRCAKLANALAQKTRAGRRNAPNVPGGDVATHAVCHDFTGDGRRDVAFAIASGGTGGAFEWAVFRRRPRTSDPAAKRFRKVAERRSGTHTSMTRRRRLLVVRNPIYRADDPNCCPTGGERLRSYRVKANRVVLVDRRRVPAE